MYLTKRDDVIISGDHVTYDPDQESTGPRFKAEASVSEGYTNITNLANWNFFGRQANATLITYTAFRNQIMTDYLPAGEWKSGLTDDEKRILIRHYIWPSAETQENLDALYSQAERDYYRDLCIEALNDNCEMIRCDCTDGTFRRWITTAGVFSTPLLTTDTNI